MATKRPNGGGGSNGSNGIKRLARELAPEERDEPLDEDFQFALRELLETYKPVLEEDLKRAASPDALIKEALANPPSCEEEFAYAQNLFARFTSEEVAMRLLPAAAREIVGPVERLRWCLLHLRCCLVFGWLLCRSPRTFRAAIYYLYRYWRCVREALGAPVSDPPTAAEREDFATLVKSLAAAYRPYLTDQLATAEFPAGLAEEVFGGKLDCFEGAEAQVAILDRFLTTDTAPALLGKELLARHRQDPFFWFCRCWCLCAIRFGCCLARARTLRDAFRCLRAYRRCLRECFRPLHCAITAPSGCVRGYTDILPGRILEPVTGDADGYTFARYVIEVRDPSGDLLSGVVVYPNGVGAPDAAATQGNFVVSGGTLGWIDTKKCAVDAGVDLLTSTTFAVTLRVFASDGSELAPPCATTFSLAVNEVYIKRVSTPWSVDYPNPDEPLRVSDSAAAALATVGGTLHVRGAANIYGCEGEKIREYTIWAIPDPGFAVPQPLPYTAVMPGVDWTMVRHIEFTPQTIAQPSGPPITYTADQVRAKNVLDGDPSPTVLTGIWGSRSECICTVVDFTLVCSCWNVPSLNPSAFNSGALGSGKYTFLLQVIDTSGNTFYDVQRVWVDNHPVQAAITGIGGLTPCADLYTQNPTSMFKTVGVQGTAWDALIVPADLTQPTSDNFHHFTVQFQKQGAGGWVTLVDSPSPVPARPLPAGIGALASWNLQSVDAATNPLGLPADQLLLPGQECTYVVKLDVWDRTVVNEGTVHYDWKVFPIKIINGPEPGP